eukprot:904339-Prorocentrum_minimum.AAC.2
MKVLNAFQTTNFTGAIYGTCGVGHLGPEQRGPECDIPLEQVPDQYCEMWVQCPWTCEMCGCIALRYVPSRSVGSNRRSSRLHCYSSELAAT